MSTAFQLWTIFTHAPISITARHSNVFTLTGCAREIPCLLSHFGTFIIYSHLWGGSTGVGRSLFWFSFVSFSTNNCFSSFVRSQQQQQQQFSIQKLTMMREVGSCYFAPKMIIFPGNEMSC
jgi:hypothetical protein